MTTRLVPGPSTWSMVRDRQGHREYKLGHKVDGHKKDGPANVLQTPGLPLPGSLWIIDFDIDVWAYCTHEARVNPKLGEDEGPNTVWDVEQVFSTKPEKRCQDTQFEDPLLEPIKIRGSTNTYQEEGTVDRFGYAITNSSYEQIRGPQNEWDAGRDVIVIEHNVAVLNHSLCTSMRHHVNDRTMWGYPARTIKMSDFTWSEHYYGTCHKYFTRVFTFEIRQEGWDRDVMDEGTKALKGHWDINGDWQLEFIGGSVPSPHNPAHFIRITDVNGNPMRSLLDGAGKPLNVSVDTGTGTAGAPVGINIQKYHNANFFLLGRIPTVIGP